MSLPDAAAEFARQLVTSLEGVWTVLAQERAEDLLDPESINAEVRLRELQRDRLRGAVREVLRQEGDLLSADRAQLLRDALGEPVGPDREPVTMERLNAAIRRDVQQHERGLEELVKVGREKQQLLRARLYELRGAVRDVLSNDGDLLDETRRAALVRAYRASEARIEPDPEQRETD